MFMPLIIIYRAGAYMLSIKKKAEALVIANKGTGIEVCKC
jgi:hypothetical protein